MSDPYSAPKEEAHIQDYEMEDLPLETLEDEEEVGQIGQFYEGLKFGEGEEWIEAAVARIKVREAIELAAHGEKNRDRIRTERNKKAFIEAYEDSMCSISASVAKANIARSTYYEWMKNDTMFRSEIYRLDEELNAKVEDKLKGLIANNDSQSIRYYLDRRNPDYKPTSKTEHVLGGSFEDFIYMIAAKRKAGIMPADAVILEPKQINGEQSNDNRREQAPISA